MLKTCMHIFVSLILVMFLLPNTLRAEDPTIAGQVTTPYPTLENISIEWVIQGDDNLNGVVTMRFRREGYQQWREALSLRRVPPGSNVGFSWENKHSGSLLNLLPDTNYEVELTLADSDGGSTIRTLTARTRAVPEASPNAVIRPVTPATFSSIASTAQPGDILLFSAGDYAGFTISRDGTLDEPIVLRAGEPGTAVVNGDVRLDGRSYVFLEGLIVNGMIKFNNAEGIVVKGCKVETTNSGIVSMGGGVVNAYIADNVVLGPTGWAENTVGTNGDNRGEGIQLTGPGNVICYNYVKGFRDAISTMEDSSAVNQVSIDIYNNDIEVGADDAIEADFTMGNCRIMRNRISNSFAGLSSQPSLGGPTYFIRNVMYNIIYEPFKLHRGSVGDVAFHNTSIKCGDAFAVYTGDVWSQARFRNNLFIGGVEGGSDNCRGNGRVAVLYAPDQTCDFNFDGYGSVGTGTFEGTIGGVNFSNFEEMRNNTTEHDAVQVDMFVFLETVPFISDGPFPERPIPDLRIHSQSAAVDRGEIIPNVNDNYSGSAPDLGAYETSSPLPHYGPRTDPDPNTNEAPNVPSIYSPQDGEEVNTLSPALDVYNSFDIDQDVLTYFFEIDTVNTFDSPSFEQSSEVTEGTGGITPWNPSELTNNTTYYWRVRAYDGTAYSDWSSTVSFFVNNSIKQPSSSGSVSCFITTAAYGLPMEPHVKVLKLFRDRFLLVNGIRQ